MNAVVKKIVRLPIALVKPKRKTVTCCTCTPDTCGCKQRKLDKTQDRGKVVGK